VALPDVSLGGHTEDPGTRQATRSAKDRSPDRPARRSDLDADAQVTDLDAPTPAVQATVRVTALDRCLGMLRYWAAQVSEAADRAGSHRGFADAQSESWNQYRAYVKSRAWLPEGHKGGPIEWVPVAYYNTVGNASFALDGASWMFKRMLRFNAGLLLASTVIVLWLIFG
jgi:hypothetical protein